MQTGFGLNGEIKKQIGDPSAINSNSSSVFIKGSHGLLKEAVKKLG